MTDPRAAFDRAVVRLSLDLDLTKAMSERPGFQSPRYSPAPTALAIQWPDSLNTLKLSEKIRVWTTIASDTSSPVEDMLVEDVIIQRIASHADAKTPPGTMHFGSPWRLVGEMCQAAMIARAQVLEHVFSVEEQRTIVKRKLIDASNEPKSDEWTAEIEHLTQALAALDRSADDLEAAVSDRHADFSKIIRLVRKAEALEM